jgi:predicted RNA-binding Zn-ribbon protein involved in translation (DUF1610 family)
MCHGSPRDPAGRDHCCPTCVHSPALEPAELSFGRAASERPVSAAGQSAKYPVHGRQMTASGSCPRCGERRVGNFRYCRKCGLDYDAPAHREDPITQTAVPRGAEAVVPLSAALAARERKLSEPRVGGPEDSHRTRRRGLILLVAGVCLAGSLMLEPLPFLQALRVSAAVLLVFVLPGFAAVCAALPTRPLLTLERLLASLGISLSIAMCGAMLLGATPIGLSTVSFAFVIAGSTVALSVVAWFRLGGVSRANRPNTTATAAPANYGDPSTPNEGSPGKIP